MTLSGAVRFLLMELKRELEQLTIHLEGADALLQRSALESEACQRLDIFSSWVERVAGVELERFDGWQKYQVGR